MRRLLCLVVLAGSSWASAQDANLKITFSSPAARLDKELADVGKLASVALATSPDMAQEIVLIHVKDMPLQTLMAKIAFVTSGRWTTEGTGYRLVVDSEARRGEAIASRAGRMKKIDESIKKLAETIEKKPNLTAANIGDGQTHGTASFGMTGAGLNLGGDESPAGRALIRILKLMGSGPFAAIENGGRAVWATNSNRSQGPLPGGSSGVIQTLVIEQRVLAESAAKNKKPETETGEEGEMAKQMREMFGVDTDAMTKQLDGPPAKVLLIASRDSILGGISVSLLLYDTNGKVLLSARQNLSAGGGFLNIGDLQAIPDQMKKRAKPVEGKEILLSKLSSEMQAVRSTSGMNPASLDAKIPDDLRKIMLKPDERDPLSFADSEATIALAESKGEGVVAELPDSLLQFNIGGGQEKLTLTSFDEKLRKSALISDADGVMVVKPIDPYMERKTRVDRVALGQFVRIVSGKEFAGLDDLAQYALKNPSPFETPASTSYFITFSPDVLQSGMGGRSDWDMLRLYATLTPDARNGLARGGVMPLGNLTPQQTGYATRLLFGANAHLEVEDPNAKKSDTPEFMQAALAMFKMPSDFRSEPTEAMPDGFPRRGVLTMNLSVEPVAKSTSQGMMGMAPLGLDELSMIKFFKESPQFAQMQAYMPNLNELRIGSRSIYHFKFHVAQGVTDSQTLMDNTMARDAATVPLSSLPDEMQKQLNARIEALKKLPFFNPAMFGGGRTPPPN